MLAITCLCLITLLGYLYTKLHSIEKINYSDDILDNNYNNVLLMISCIFLISLIMLVYAENIRIKEGLKKVDYTSGTYYKPIQNHNQEYNRYRHNGNNYRH